MAKDIINVGLLGLGNVGSGIIRVLLEHEESIEKKINARFLIKSILVRSTGKERDVVIDRDLLVGDPLKIIDDPEIDIVVEVLGGVEPARTIILKAIENGKHIVTANKELMANYGKEVLEAADKFGVDVYFEASVGGGIPIIHPLKESLAANKITKVMGIINGTTNYILTKMAEESFSFDKALKQAQALGYAESDPKADIEGDDAAAKIAILASIAFNARVTAKNVYTEGVSGITFDDITYAEELGYVIKLIALAKDDGEGIDVRVHPAMIPKSHPLASVKNVYNAIFVEGDAVGEVMFFGQGAGSLPTASSVVGDMIDVARNLQQGRSGIIGCTCFEKKRIKSINEISSCYYLLVDVIDQPGVLAKIAKAFGDHQVSINSVIQKQSRGVNTDLMFMTHLVRESNLRDAIREIKHLEVVNKVNNIIRVEAS